MSESKHSQVSCIGLPQPKSWDDYEQGCMGTFRGGHHDEAELKAFQHGMATVFNLLRGEFPPAEQCKAAPDLLAACEAALKLPDLSVYAEEVSGSHHHSEKKAKEYYDKMNVVLAQIRAAIARATGAAR